MSVQVCQLVRQPGEILLYLEFGWLYLEQIEAWNGLGPVPAILTIGQLITMMGNIVKNCMEPVKEMHRIP